MTYAIYAYPATAVSVVVDNLVAICDEAQGICLLSPLDFRRA